MGENWQALSVLYYSYTASTAKRSLTKLRASTSKKEGARRLGIEDPFTAPRA